MFGGQETRSTVVRSVVTGHNCLQAFPLDVEALVSSSIVDFSSSPGKLHHDPFKEAKCRRAYNSGGDEYCDNFFRRLGGLRRVQTVHFKTNSGIALIFKIFV